MTVMKLEALRSAGATVRRIPVAGAATLIVMALAAPVTAAQQPDRPAQGAPIDPSGQRVPDAQPTGEQHRTPIEKDTDQKGNDRDFTTERGDRDRAAGSAAGLGADADNANASEQRSMPLVPIGAAVLAVIAIAAVLMLARSRSRSPKRPV